MNSPTACSAHFHTCHCVLEPHPADAPHECVPDPVCGGSWNRVDSDEPGMVRIYRYPGNRPGCDGYEASREHLAELGIEPAEDPAPGEYVFEHDGIFRAPRGGIRYITPPEADAMKQTLARFAFPSDLPLVGDLETMRDLARAEEQRLLEQMRAPDE